MREQGSIISFETGAVTAYALDSAQDKGTLFIRPGDQVCMFLSVNVVFSPLEICVHVSLHARVPKQNNRVCLFLCCAGVRDAVYRTAREGRRHEDQRVQDQGTDQHARVR